MDQGTSSKTRFIFHHNTDDAPKKKARRTLRQSLSSSSLKGIYCKKDLYVNLSFFQAFTLQWIHHIEQLIQRVESTKTKSDPL